MKKSALKNIAKMIENMQITGIERRQYKVGDKVLDTLVQGNVKINKPFIVVDNNSQDMTMASLIALSPIRASMPEFERYKDIIQEYKSG